MKTGERRPFEFSFRGPYSRRPGFSHSLEGATIQAARIARAVLGWGHDPNTHSVTVTQRANGREIRGWRVDADGNRTETWGRE